jgi:hypothetical protein
MHLVSKKKGTVTKINHEDEINAMGSVRLLEIEPKVGGEVVETVNIRTDSGYVLLENVSSEALQGDYNRILELQDTMFEVEGDGIATEAEADATVVIAEEQETEQVAVSKSRRRRRTHALEPEPLLPSQEQVEVGLQYNEQEMRQSQGPRRGLEEKGSSVSNIASHPQVGQLAKKASRIAIRTVAMLAAYCIVAYSAALALPVVYRP